MWQDALQFGFHVFLFVLASFIGGFGLFFAYCNWRVFGPSLFVLGLLVGLCNGFAAIGEGPFGWLCWISE